MVRCNGESTQTAFSNSNTILEDETKLFACQLMEKFAVYRARNLEDKLVCLQELSLFDNNSKIYVLVRNFEKSFKDKRR